MDWQRESVKIERPKTRTKSYCIHTVINQDGVKFTAYRKRHSLCVYGEYQGIKIECLGTLRNLADGKKWAESFDLETWKLGELERCQNQREYLNNQLTLCDSRLRELENLSLKTP